MLGEAKRKERLKIIAKKHIGEVYDRLVVVKFSHLDRRRTPVYKCKCKCGKTKLIVIDSLKAGLTKSCGCLKAELIKDRFRVKYGITEKNEYLRYLYMKSRCAIKTGEVYKNYSKRGITVCERWKESFKNFYTDMGKMPSKKHTLERIDNNKGYSPENCKWATRQEQVDNRTVNRKVKHNGVVKTLTAWSKELNIPFETLIQRDNRGLKEEFIFYKGNLVNNKQYKIWRSTVQY